MEKKVMNVGVVGAGAISGIYLDNMIGMFENLEVKSICAKHLEKARKKAEKYGLQPCTCVDMLADPCIELVVILTPVDTHYGLIRQALESGKHVYTEKTMTETTQQAAELFQIANEKGLYIGSAPDTFLGTGFQTARKAIEDGKIGEINSFSIAINRNNDILTSAVPFLRFPGAGALRDYQVYYLTALISLLGPVEQVGAFVRTPYKKRIASVPGMPDYGKEIDTPNESIVSAILKLKSGVTGTIHQDNETIMEDRADFVIYGRKGILLLGNANEFGNPVRLVKTDREDDQKPRILTPVGSYSENSRGAGVSELADAIFHGRKNRACKELAYHVLDILECMEKSSQTGSIVTVGSSCEKPAML